MSFPSLPLATANCRKNQRLSALLFSVTAKQVADKIWTPTPHVVAAIECVRLRTNRLFTAPQPGFRNDYCGDMPMIFVLRDEQLIFQLRDHALVPGCSIKSVCRAERAARLDRSNNQAL